MFIKFSPPEDNQKPLKDGKKFKKKLKILLLQAMFCKMQTCRAQYESNNN